MDIVNDTTLKNQLNKIKTKITNAFGIYASSPQLPRIIAKQNSVEVSIVDKSKVMNLSYINIEAAYLFAVFFDSNDKIISISTNKPITEIPSNARYIKGFAWNSPNDIMPICEELTLQIKGV